MKQISLIITTCSILLVNISFSQNDKVAGDKFNGDKVMGNKITIIQNIQKTIPLPADQSLLFFGFQLSDLRFDSAQSKQLIERCSSLNELCLNSIKDEKFYQKNKSRISDFMSEIFKLQQTSFKEAFVQKIKKDYNNTRKENFILSISTLKVTNDNDSAQTLLNYFDRTIYEAWKLDSTYFLSNLIKDNFYLLIDAFSKRLEKTNSTVEVDKLFKLINSFSEADFNPKWDNHITLKVSESLKKQFGDTKIFLGQLLLEGYKDFLISKGKFPKNPTSEDVRRVYKYIFPVSNEITLNRNILFAQITLLTQGDLICEQKLIDKIQSGWNWPEDEKRMNKIPFLMFNRSLIELKQGSQLGDTVLTLNKEYYSTRENIIKLFNYKYSIFSKIQRIDTKIENSIFNDPLLQLGQINSNHYNGCTLINHVYYQSLYSFPK